MNDYEFGNFIYELRVGKGLSQSELGKLLGVSNKAVSKWEMGVAKPRAEKLTKLAQIFDVTVEELLLGRRKQKDGEISFAIDILVREYRRARRCLISSVVYFFASPVLLLLTLLIFRADYTSIAAIVIITFLTITHFVSEACVIVFLIITNNRKRLLYTSFPQRRQEVSIRSRTIPPAKKTGKLGLIVILGSILMLIAVALILSRTNVVDGLIANIIFLCGSLALALVEILFTQIYIRMMRRHLLSNDYERVIKEGKFLLEVWLPDGRGNLPDLLRLDIAVSYFALYDDENFRDYLGELTSRGFLLAKSYWKCIDAFARNDKTEFSVEYTEVFLPLYNATAIKNVKAAEFYGKPLKGISELLEGKPVDKSKILALVSNARVRETIQAFL